MPVSLLLGDCIEKLAELPDSSVDSIVTDPPYGLSFMGKKWDYDVPSVDIWKECLRVLKPGGHLLAFAGTRTQHRMAVNIEDAGFEIRDLIAWVYGSGFPKSLDVSKAIDKAAGAERARYERPAFGGTFSDDNGSTYGTAICNTPATPEAQQWAGWGTALKPAMEPVTVARRPLSGTVAANVLAHRTGGLNVDGCRVAMSSDDADFIRKTARPNSAGQAHNDAVMNRPAAPTVNVHPAGRWPANLIHDGSDEVVELFPQQAAGSHPQTPTHSANAAFGGGRHDNSSCYADTGSAARFFYCAKTSKRERGEGNNHPTVKPIALMRYLCRLVTPPGGTILDPFMGSGSTGLAALQEGFSFIGVEREPEYMDIARRRIGQAQQS
jgi:hypothetical protein